MKDYCPILMIGFHAPKDGQNYDPRTCKKDCAWYDNEYEQCVLHTLKDRSEDIVNAIAELNFVDYGDTPFVE